MAIARIVLCHAPYFVTIHDDADVSVDIPRYETSPSATTTSSTWRRPTNCFSVHFRSTACRRTCPTGCSAKQSASCRTCSASPTSTPAYWRWLHSALIDVWPATTTPQLFDEFRSVWVFASASGSCRCSLLCRTRSAPRWQPSAAGIDVLLSWSWRPRSAVPGSTRSWCWVSSRRWPLSPAPTPSCSGDFVVGRRDTVSAAVCRRLVRSPWRG